MGPKYRLRQYMAAHDSTVLSNSTTTTPPTSWRLPDSLGIATLLQPDFLPTHDVKQRTTTRARLSNEPRSRNAQSRLSARDLDDRTFCLAAVAIALNYSARSSLQFLAEELEVKLNNGGAEQSFADLYKKPLSLHDRLTPTGIPAERHARSLIPGFSLFKRNNGAM
jgi:hypothetical protein